MVRSNAFHGQILSILLLTICRYEQSNCSVEFTARPRNSAAFVGSDVVLPCAANNSKRFAWDLNDHAVYSGFEVAQGFKDRFEVTSEARQFDLHIHRVQPSDAGEYKCTRTVSVSASAQLVVTESNASCSADHETHFLVADVDNLTIDCSLNYSGNWAPQLYWEQINGSQTSPVESQPCPQHHQTRTRTVCVGLLKRVRADMRDVIYRCTGRFTLTDKPSQTTAQNNINWTSSCVAHKLNIAYGPRSLKIERLSDDRSQLRCASDSNPPAEYRWFRNDEPDFIDTEQRIDMCKFLSGGVAAKFLCEARNTVTNLTETAVITFNNAAWSNLVNTCQDKRPDKTLETEDGETTVPTYTYITWGVLAVVVTVFIIVFIIFGVYIRSRLAGMERPVRATETHTTSQVPEGHQLTEDAPIMNSARVIYDEIEMIADVVQTSNVTFNIANSDEATDTPYFHLDPSTLEPPPDPSVYDRLTRRQNRELPPIP